MQCTFKEQTSECNVYMVLPVFGIFFFVLWMDRTFQRNCKYCCTRCPHECRCSPSLCSIIHDILKASSVSLLWAISLFIDGDWYVCCLSDHSGNQTQLACKDKNNLTAEEQTSKAELKNKSMVSVFVPLYTACQSVQSFYVTVVLFYLISLFIMMRPYCKNTVTLW